MLRTQAASLAKAGFGEGLLRFFFFGARASSRFDAISHILPSRGELNACVPYDTGAPISECAALFHPGQGAARASSGGVRFRHQHWRRQQRR